MTAKWQLMETDANGDRWVSLPAKLLVMALTASLVWNASQYRQLSAAREVAAEAVAVAPAPNPPAPGPLPNVAEQPPYAGPGWYRVTQSWAHLPTDPMYDNPKRAAYVATEEEWQAYRFGQCVLTSDLPDPAPDVYTRQSTDGARHDTEAECLAEGNAVQ